MDTSGLSIGDYVTATEYAKQKVTWVEGDNVYKVVGTVFSEVAFPRGYISDLADDTSSVEVPLTYYRRATPAEVDAYLRKVRAEKEQKKLDDVVTQLADKRKTYDTSADAYDYLSRIINNARKQPLSGYRADTIITDEIEDEETLEELLDELEDNKAERRELLLKVKRLVDAELA